MVVYTKKWIAHLTGTSLGITLTYPLKTIGVNVGDEVIVIVNDDNTITIKKVKKK